MRNKLFTLLFAVIAIFSLVACVDTGTTNKPTNPENGEETQNPTGSETKENSVKIKSINAQETSDVQATYAKAKMRQSRNSGDDTNNSADEFNYIIITRPQTDITFTITLDNPEAYGIDALRVYCDDENAQIQVDGEYKPIAKEPDGTRVVNWSSEDPYERTYNIRTTSEDAINSFKVVDVRLAGHDKFQSKETNSTDLGNNELHIYKMDEDAYTLNVIENTFDYIKFNFNVKEEYKDIISNIRVGGLEMDEELGYWMLEESKDVSITYDYYLEEYDIKVNREDAKRIDLLFFSIPVSSNERYSPIYTKDNYWLHYDDNGIEKIKFIPILKINIEFNYNVDINVYYDNKLLKFIDYEYGYWSDSEDSKYSYYIYSLEDTDFTEFDTRYSNFTLNDINHFLNKITLEINNSKYKINQINFIEYSKGYFYFNSFELFLEE